MRACQYHMPNNHKIFQNVFFTNTLFQFNNMDQYPKEKDREREGGKKITIPWFINTMGHLGF